MDGWKQASKQAAKQETTPQQVVQLPSVVEAVQRNSPKFQTLLSCVCLVCLCVCVCVCVCVHWAFSIHIQLLHSLCVRACRVE